MEWHFQALQELLQSCWSKGFAMTWTCIFQHAKWWLTHHGRRDVWIKNPHSTTLAGGRISDTLTNTCAIGSASDGPKDLARQTHLRSSNTSIKTVAKQMQQHLQETYWFPARQMHVCKKQMYLSQLQLLFWQCSMCCPWILGLGRGCLHPFEYIAKCWHVLCDIISMWTSAIWSVCLAHISIAQHMSRCVQLAQCASRTVFLVCLSLWMVPALLWSVYWDCCCYLGHACIDVVQAAHPKECCLHTEWPCAAHVHIDVQHAVPFMHIQLHWVIWVCVWGCQTNCRKSRNWTL